MIVVTNTLRTTYVCKFSLRWALTTPKTSGLENDLKIQSKKMQIEVNNTVVLLVIYIIVALLR